MASPVKECCGLGCNNCILDRYLELETRHSYDERVTNLFCKRSYQKFRVKDIKKLRDLVYLFNFQICCEGREPYGKFEQLIAPPVSYLMLRAPRNFDDEPMPTNPLFEEDKEFVVPARDESDGTVYYRSQPQRFDKGTPEVYFSRKYTPFEVNEELRTFKIIVKLEQHGKMSRYFSRLQLGSVCEFKGPFEVLSYYKEAIENYIVITQGKRVRLFVFTISYQLSILGISIVSAFRLVKEIIYESAQSRILVLSCFKNLNETYLRDDFEKLTHYWCLKHYMFMSEDVTRNCDGSSSHIVPPRSCERIRNERLDHDVFHDLMKELKYYHPERTQVLISGRENFIREMEAIVMDNRYLRVRRI